MQKVSEVMHRGIEVIDANATVSEAARKMREMDIGFLCVTINDKIQGCLTDRDLVLRALAEEKAANATIGEFTGPHIVSTSANSSIEEAVEVMKENRTQRLVITDDGGTPLGVVTLADLIDRCNDPSLVINLLKEIKVPLH